MPSYEVGVSRECARGGATGVYRNPSFDRNNFEAAGQRVARRTVCVSDHNVATAVGGSHKLLNNCFEFRTGGFKDIEI